MESTDPSRLFAVEVVRRLQASGFQAFWAGGCVRDLQLRLRPADYDVATNALPEQVRQLFGPRQTLAIGAAFGVILVRAPRGSGATDVEVATFRTEGPYRDGRRPEQVRFSTPEHDALRRDFTINGLFLDPISGQFFDYVGGQSDLENRLVRAIGDPRERFLEDKLRMLRAVRITARFDFELDPATAEAIREMAGQIKIVSQERISQELGKMLVHPRRSRAVDLAARLGLLPVILPELATAFASSGCLEFPGSEESVTWQRLLRGLDALPSPDFELALAMLLRPIVWQGDGVPGEETGAGQQVRQTCRRLRLSNESIAQCVWLTEHGTRLSGVETVPISTRKRLLGHRWGRNLIALMRAEAVGQGDQPIDADICEAYLDVTPAAELTPEPWVTGADLISLQVPSGPVFKEILEGLYERQLLGEFSNRDEALAAAVEGVEQRLSTQERKPNKM